MDFKGVPRGAVPEAARDGKRDVLSLEPGTLIAGRYRIERFIKKGGMAAVYRARDENLPRDVALKFLLPELQAREEILGLFANEARIFASFQHPNIVTLYDHVESEYGFFLCLEFIEGGALSQFVKSRHDLTTDERLEIFRGICSGVSFAHRKGVIHRDLTPGNILIGESRTPKVTDFGIAKKCGSDLSKSGFGMGTPYYTAPEVLEDARSADFRADVYSLGAVLYFLFKREPPPMAADPSGLPARVRDVVTGCLRYSREERPGTVEEILSILDGGKQVPCIYAEGVCPFCHNEHPETARRCVKTGNPLFRDCPLCGFEKRSILFNHCAECGCHGEKMDAFNRGMEKAKEYFSAGELEGALSELDLAIRSYDEALERVDSRQEKAVARTEALSLRQATVAKIEELASLKRAEELKGRAADCLRRAAELGAEGEMDEAIEKCREALDACPDDGEARRLLGVLEEVLPLWEKASVALDDGRREDEMEYLARVLAVYPECGFAAEALAEARRVVERERYRKALSRAEELFAERKYEDLLSTAGGAEPHLDGSSRLLELAAEAREAVEQSNALLREALSLREADELFDALAAVLKSLEIYPHNDPARSLSGEIDGTLRRWAEGLEERGMLNEALKTFDELSGFFPEDSSLQARRAEIGEKLKQSEYMRLIMQARRHSARPGEASEAVEAALRLYPESSEALHMKQAIMARAAREEYDAMVAEARKSYADGQYEKSREIAGRAASLVEYAPDAKDIEARASERLREAGRLFREAEALLREGVLDRSRTRCSEALALNPSMAEARELMQLLGRIDSLEKEIASARAAGELESAMKKGAELTALLPPEAGWTPSTVRAMMDEIEEEMRAKRHDARLDEAKRLLARGEYRKARALLASVLKVEPAHEAARALEEEAGRLHESHDDRKRILGILAMGILICLCRFFVFPMFGGLDYSSGLDFPYFATFLMVIGMSLWLVYRANRSASHLMHFICLLVILLVSVFCLDPRGIAGYDKPPALNQGKAEPHNSRGEAVRKLEDDRKALLALNQRKAESFNSKGEAAAKLKDYQKAIECYDNALSIKANYPVALKNRGLALFGLGRYEESVKAYDQAICLVSDYGDAWLDKGNSLVYLNRLDDAQACYEKAISLNKDDVDAWCNKGMVLDEKARHGDAIVCFDRALAINAGYVNALVGKGVSLEKLRKFEDAMRCFERAIALRPDSADAWHHKGRLLHGLGRYDEAMRCYDKALAITPDSAARLDRAALVKALRKAR